MERTWSFFTKFAAIVVALLFLLPVGYMLAISLKPEGASWLSADGFLGINLSTINYLKVIGDAPIFGWMANSLIIAVCTTTLILLISSLAAYPFSRNPFPGSKMLFMLFLSGLMIPSEATLIPLFLEMRDFGLLNTRLSVIMPAVAGPLGIFIMKQFFDGLPKELEEAARIDGAGHLRIWFSLFLPLSRPALSALGIFTFIGSWNDFLWPLISITDKTQMTITLGLPLFESNFANQYGLPMAANALGTIPILIVFVFFQKQIIRGIAFTGGKES